MTTKSLAGMTICLMASLLAGCTDRQKEAREQCEQNLRIIWTASRSYRLEHNLPVEAVIRVEDLKNYIQKNGQMPRCPLGTNDYMPFIYTNGPVCPNAPDSHTSPRVKEVIRI